MFNKYNKNKNNKGFTLIELLTVVLLIGVLASISVPLFMRAVEKSRAAESINLLGTIAKAEQRAKLQNNEYVDKFSKLDIYITPYTAGNENDSKIDTEHFDFTLKSNYAQSERKTDEYTLYVAYDTNKITCADNGSGICQRLGLDEETEFNQPQWETCSDTAIGDVWGSIFGGSIYTSYNQSHSASCQMKVNKKTGQTEFDFCYDTSVGVTFAVTSNLSASSSLKCAKGIIYENENKAIASFCYNSECKKDWLGGYDSFYIEKEPDGSILRITCQSYNYETNTCNYTGRNIYYYNPGDNYAYCSQFDSQHRCTNCSGSGCNAISGKVIPF